MKTSIPFSRPSRTTSRTGRIRPVRFVIWGNSMTLVRGVIASRMRATNASGEGSGIGKEIFLTTMPSRRARWFQVVIIRG